MKKIVIVASIIMMTTGCSTLQQRIKDRFTDSNELAQRECSQIGLRSGTAQYQQCVITTANSIRTARALQAQASARANAAAMAAASAAMPERRQQCYINNSYIYCY